MKEKTLSRQSHWCCSWKREGRIEMDKSAPIPIGNQCYRYSRTKAKKSVSRKGLIRARTALSPASLYFFLFNLGSGDKGQLYY
jgi:hypothetical protein